MKIDVAVVNFIYNNNRVILDLHLFILIKSSHFSFDGIMMSVLHRFNEYQREVLILAHSKFLVFPL